MTIGNLQRDEPRVRGIRIDETSLHLASSSEPAPATLEPELVRALNERIAIIDGMAELLLLSTTPDKTAKAALQAIRRQAQGVRELFLQP
ncbi:MAG: hypothetical protein ACLGIB_04785 [Actinomycetota bacterium]